MAAHLYYDALPEDIKKYFSILCSDFPDWIEEYVATPEMMRLKNISQICAVDFLHFWDTPRFYNVLDHSVACCLITWNFTNDKKQALAALFHDIATPAFKHCIDIMNNDAIKQESTEQLTYDIIKNSKSIRSLLRRDHIRPKEVANPHYYPIVDNDSPRLSSDRLEYTFMNAYLVRDYGVKMPLSKIRRYYQNLTIGKNEDGIEELSFFDYKIAEEFVSLSQKLWHNWLDNRYQLTGKIYAEIIKKAISQKVFSIDDLYKMTDKEAIEKLQNSRNKTIATAMRKLLKAKRFYTGNNISEKQRKGAFVVSAYPIKVRFLDPLVCTDYEVDLHLRSIVPHTSSLAHSFERLSRQSEMARKYIDDIHNYPVKKYAWLRMTV